MAYSLAGDDRAEAAEACLCLKNNYKVRNEGFVVRKGNENEVFKGKCDIKLRVFNQ